MKQAKYLMLVVIALSVLVGIFVYPHLGPVLASHWNAAGEVNSYTSKFWGLFLLPIIMLALYLLYLLIPRIDPLRVNIESFRKYFDGFMLLLFIFFVYIYLLTIFWNLGYRFPMILALLPAFASLFYYGGILLEKSERNWFIGVRTPWTISSDRVWRRTNTLGGKLFKAAGIITLIGFFIPQEAIWFVLAPIIAFAVYLVVFSYLEYKKEQL